MMNMTMYLVQRETDAQESLKDGAEVSLTYKTAQTAQTKNSWMCQSCGPEWIGHQAHPTVMPQGRTQEEADGAKALPKSPEKNCLLIQTRSILFRSLYKEVSFTIIL